MAVITEKVECTLKAFHLRSTEIRRSMLTLFLDVEHALSHSEIEHKMQNKYDRVTIYRTLNTFEEKRIIHKIIDSQTGISKYAICLNEDCTKNQLKSGEHVHFKCDVCGRIFCLDNIQINKTELPKGYKLHSLTISARGLCKDCTIKTN